MRNHHSSRRAPLPVRFWRYVQKTPDCWLWTGYRKNGYGSLYIKTRRAEFAHRISWTLHHGPIPTGLHVLHRCDNRPCIRPDHLFLGTHADNMRDMSRKGRSSVQRNPELARRGAQNGHATLNESDVHEIRRLMAEGVAQTVIGKRFGVSNCTVSAIKHGRLWAHLLSPPLLSLP